MKHLTLLIFLIGFNSAFAQTSGEELDWSKQVFEAFPTDSSHKFTNVTSLKLRRVQMKNIGKLDCCANLVELDLSDNLLSSIEAESFNSLVALRSLNLSSNQLVRLPIQNPFPKQIEYLDLSLNKLEILPEYLFQLEYLKVINLRGKQLYNYSRSDLKEMFGADVKVYKSPSCKCD